MNPHSLPKIKLRAMEPEDLDMLYHIENDTQLWGVSSTNVPYSRYTLHDFIANSSNDIYADQQVRLIIENEEAQVVGIADLVNFDPRHNRAEIGIVIQQSFRSQGYAQAAVTRLHEYASKVLHLHQLYAVIASTGTDVLSLFNYMGYKEVAVLPDWLFDGHAYSDAVVMQMIL